MDSFAPLLGIELTVAQTPQTPLVSQLSRGSERQRVVSTAWNTVVEGSVRCLLSYHLFTSVALCIFSCNSRQEKCPPGRSVRSQEGPGCPRASDLLVLGVQPPMSPLGPNGTAAVFSRSRSDRPAQQEACGLGPPAVGAHDALGSGRAQGMIHSGGKQGKQCLSLSSRN